MRVEGGGRVGGGLLIGFVTSGEVWGGGCLRGGVGGGYVLD